MMRFLVVSLLALASPVGRAAPDFTSVDRLLVEAVADGTVAGGTVLVLQNGKPVYKKPFGYANLKAKTPFPFDAPVVVACSASA